MEDVALPASETARNRAIEERLQRIERRLNYYPIPLPTQPIFGTPQTDGFWSHTTAAVTDVFRVDAYVAAPTLDYDIQQTDQYGTTATSITVEIDILGFGVFPDQNIMTDTSSPDTQVSGLLSLVDLVGDDVLGRFVSFRVGVGRSGGSVAGVRLNKPLVLRIRSA